MNISDKKSDCHCGGTTERKRITKTIPLRGEKIVLENVLARVCPNCGEVYLDGKMIDKIDQRLKKEKIETV